MTNSFQKFLRTVEEKGLKTKNVRDASFMFECPSHNDGNPSVSVNYRSSRTLCRCHAGCDTRDIVADLGLAMDDLFDDELEQDKRTTIVAAYDYYDPATGELSFQHLRLFPKDFRFRHYDKAGKEVWRMPQNAKPWLYRYDRVKEAIENGEVIYLVEGEADVHAMERLGGVATTQPNGAGPGKWQELHTRMLEGAAEVRIVVDLDADKADGSNTGRDYAYEIRESLTASGIRTTLWKSPEGKDTDDAYRAGKTLDDFTKYDLHHQGPKGTRGDELVQKEFPPLIFAVQDILPQGVAILASGPKLGKSWMALDMAIGVASGGLCLGGMATTQGDVLYLGFEDSERRIKSRIDALTEGNYPDLERILFQSLDTGWVGGDRGLANMEFWALNAESPRLVVVDTYGKAEPDMGSTPGNSYLQEQATMLKYKKFSDRHDCSVLLIHHDRKSNDSEDWMDRISGTKGTTGGLDVIMYMDVKRGEREGSLRVDGRDIESDAYPIVKVPGRPFWALKRVPERVPEDWSVEAIQARLDAQKAAEALQNGLGATEVGANDSEPPSAKDGPEAAT